MVTRNGPAVLRFPVKELPERFDRIHLALGKLKTSLSAAPANPHGISKGTDSSRGGARYICIQEG